jgi:uncharacterized protein YggT (Ycf19 family)
VREGYNLPEFLYVLVRFVIIFAEILSTAMFLRAILSWFFEGDGKFMRFLYVFTEPAIMPLRKLFYKMNWFQDLPVDMSFTFTFIALFVIETMLSSLL